MVLLLMMLQSRRDGSLREDTAVAVTDAERTTWTTTTPPATLGGHAQSFTDVLCSRPHRHRSRRRRGFERVAAGGGVEADAVEAGVRVNGFYTGWPAWRRRRRQTKVTRTFCWTYHVITL